MLINGCGRSSWGLLSSVVSIRHVGCVRERGLQCTWLFLPWKCVFCCCPSLPHTPNSLASLPGSAEKLGFMCSLAVASTEAEKRMDSWAQN